MNRSLRQQVEELESTLAPSGTLPPGAAGALSGVMAASILAAACGAALGDRRTEKSSEELATIRDRALSLKRDLASLLEQQAQAERRAGSARAEGAAGGAPAARPEPERLRALLFASEVPLRIAESCHALLNLSLRALGRIGIRAIAEIGTATALAFSGVAGGIVTARAYLAVIPPGSGIGATATRKRAERIFREAESLRTQITDRVRQHLP